MLKSIVTKVFGTANDKMVKKYLKKVQNINALESKYEPMSDDELKSAFNALKDSVNSGEKTLDDVLYDSFAITREASKRVLEMRLFDVQLVGVWYYMMAISLR